jgi:4-amino-4-deoxy-L-arabinose transferase-like glycosyltransferase
MRVESTTWPRLSRVALVSWPVALLVGILALLPRGLGLADFFTIDEADHWILRVRLFSQALQQHNWAGTNLTGHPGVTTMWLGAIGRQLALATGIAPSGDSAAYLALLRLPLAAVDSLAVAVGYMLLRRIVRPSLALLAAILWATEPFLIAHSRLLHVDALVTSFSTISVLLLVLATPLVRRPLSAAGSWSAIAASGICAGLALLSKVSALALLAWAGLFLAAIALTDRGSIAAHDRQWWRSVRWWLAAARQTLLRYLAWLACAALAMFALWPAMWVAPLAAVGGMIEEAIINGGQPHAWGNYFLGQPIADPGPLFYPVAVLWRSAPLTLIGLLGLPLVFLRSRATGHAAEEAVAVGGRSPERWVYLALLSWILLFGIAVSVGAKKFDRYALPLWPALDILAAAGLVALLESLGRLVQRGRGAQRQARATFRAVATFGLGALLLGFDMLYHPYYLAYFNPLLGGGPVAQKLLLVGWGEGMEHAAAWLRTRPDLERGFVLSWIPDTLQPFLPRSVRALDIRTTTIAMRNPAPNYAVVYARGAMREDTPDLAAYVSQTPPLYQVRMYGLDYATIYQVPKPYDLPLGAQYGPGLELRGISQQRIGSTLVITPSWSVERDQPGSVFSFVHVLGPDGQRVAQIDAPLDDGMFAQWQAGQQFGTALPIALPAGLPAGQYRVILGLYLSSDGSRLPLSQPQALPPDVDGPHALLLTTLSIR